MNIKSLLSQLSKELNGVDINKIIDKYNINKIDDFSDDQSLRLLANICANMALDDYNYSLLGGRILMHNLYANIGLPGVKFVDNLKKIHTDKNNEFTSRVSEEVLKFCVDNEDYINSLWTGQYDFDLDYSAVQSYEKRGLEIIDCKILETPSFKNLRVAIGLNVNKNRTSREKEIYENKFGKKLASNCLEKRSKDQILADIKELFISLVKREISLPGPIILHAGSQHNQMSSCYLQYCGDSLTGDTYVEDGVVGGIMKAMTQLASQSKGGGGNAIAIHDVRASGSLIKSTNGKSNGILPFMKMFDATIGSVNQSGKRAGTCAVYLEPWHADIIDYLDAGNHFTIEEKRCKNLFYGLYVNDLFFQRMVTDMHNAKWTLFDPKIAEKHIGKPLSECYGDEFKQKYEYLESLGVGREINLLEIWLKVLNLFQTTGNPYIVNKDQMNIKSNQSNIGTIKSSNLCTEIALVSNNDETAVCVLSSICLGRFYNPILEDMVDYEGIIKASQIATRALNNVIDLQYYPSLESRNSCLARRAIGVGAQGLADLFALLDISFTSDVAKVINKKVYECIYYGCMLESNIISIEQKRTYEGYEGSKISNGIFQFDMWDINRESLFLKKRWIELETKIKKYGVMNSEVTALAPTASSSIRMGNNEMHEPFTRNLYVRQTIFGSIQVVNKYLMNDLKAKGMWDEDIVNQILDNDGSVQNIEHIPTFIKNKYKTAYEINWRDLVDMMADRSVFVSQSSSFNHHTPFEDANQNTYTQKIIYGWKKKLKTLSYYMHTETASTAKKTLSNRTNQSKKTTPIVREVECFGCDA